jgi:hypothetical protein
VPKRSPGTGRRRAHKVTRANDSNGLAALLCNFFRSALQLDLTGRAVRFGQKTRNNEALISPCETKRFAEEVVSYWNHYERRITHFAGSFVFNDYPVFVSPFRVIIRFQ